MKAQQRKNVHELLATKPGDAIDWVIPLRVGAR